MQNILDLNLADLQKEFKEMGLPAFRAKQVFLWLHRKLEFEFDNMTDLPEPVRSALKEKYRAPLPERKKTSTSKDGTKKYLFTMSDGSRIESVLLEDHTERKTICVSTQAGCALSCEFCATGQLGFKRNLAVSEILGQIYQIISGGEEISNLVFMGMGEPFLNYENVVKSIRILISKEGQNIGQRKITVSTGGIPDGIRAFANEDFQVRLAVSLNSADDAVRSRLMPVNRKYPLEPLFEAIKYYISTANRRVTLEYIMLDGINDRNEDLLKLINFCKRLYLVNVNLIPFNRVGDKLRPSNKDTVNGFLKSLENNGVVAVARQRRGEDIDAACGQLAGGNQ